MGPVTPVPNERKSFMVLRVYNFATPGYRVRSISALVIPLRYFSRRLENRIRPLGGLAGILPPLIALVSFSLLQLKITVEKLGAAKKPWISSVTLKELLRGDKLSLRSFNLDLVLGSFTETEPRNTSDPRNFRATIC